MEEPEISKKLFKCLSKSGFKVKKEIYISRRIETPREKVGYVIFSFNTNEILIDFERGILKYKFSNMEDHSKVVDCFEKLGLRLLEFGIVYQDEREIRRYEIYEL